jgi:DNA transformation protein
MSEFVTSLHEVFERLGHIEAKRMFGGHGIYLEGRMFGLVSGDTLYLKTDAESVAHFDRLGRPAFQYVRAGKTMQTSYREAPAELFEDREEAATWGRRAWEAALRSGRVPGRRKGVGKSTSKGKDGKPAGRKAAAPARR